MTAIVQETENQKFNAFGMVMKPGLLRDHKPATVLDAIAMASSFRDHVLVHSNGVAKTIGP